MAFTLRIVACVAALFIAGCATGGVSLRKPDLSRVSIGMTKAEVIAAIGKPHQVSAEAGRESLLYGYDAVDGVMEIHWYGVLLQDGRVAAYGPAGVHQADTSALFAMAANTQSMAASAQAMRPSQTVIVAREGNAETSSAQQPTFQRRKTYRVEPTGGGSYQVRESGLPLLE